MSASTTEDLMNHNSENLYDPLSRAFHWVTAVVVSIAFVLGPEGFGRLIRHGIDPATRTDILWHETLGILVFLLTVLRLFWVAFRPQTPQTGMAGSMQIIAKLTHVALWVLLLALPITAILALGSQAHPLTLLGGMQITEMPWISTSTILKLVDWGDVHKFLGDAMMGLAGLHAVAAIYHHVVRKDGVLVAMLPLKILR